MYLRLLSLATVVVLSVGGRCQVSGTGASAPSPGQRPTISLQDALVRAKMNNPQFRAAVMQSGLAREDRVQARAALLPSVDYVTGAIYTEPTRESSPRFIAANGVREYISQGAVHQSIGFTSFADYRRAHAAEALANAQAEIAARGLVVTVVQSYYGAIVGQRKTANAQQAANEAQRFLDLSERLEKGGEVAHADVIKARLQANDSVRALQESQLAAEKARLGLAVLLFPVFTQDFDLVDDLRFAAPLPQLAEAQALAARNNPELKAALAAAQVASNEVQSAVGGHLPTLSLDYFYGIDAPQYATYTDGVRNLGYQVPARSAVANLQLGRDAEPCAPGGAQTTQAQVELSATQRQALADLQVFYSEALTAKNQIEILKRSADLAQESLRLTTLRYQAGEATALEIVDAQNALALAEQTYYDGEVRYRLAVANLQTLTGAF